MKLISKKQTRAIVVISPTQMGRLEELGKFPKRLRLGVGRNARVVYVESEVIAWAEARVAERDKLR